MSEVNDFGPDFGISEEEAAALQEPAPQEVQPQPEAPADQPPAQEPEPQQPESTEERQSHHVPLTALLDEREKRQKLERELEQFRAQAQPQAPQPPQVPDPYEDPAGYQQYIQAQIDDRTFKATAEISGRFAEQKYGKETVEEAVRWAQEQGAKDPTLGQRVRASNDPVGFVVEQFQREQFWQKYQSDPSVLTQATNQTAAPQMAAPVVTKPIAPPRSLAAAPGAGGGHQSIPDGSVLDSVKFNLD